MRRRARSSAGRGERATVVVEQLQGVAEGEPAAVKIMREAELDATDRVQSRALLAAQLELERAQVLLRLGQRARADDRDHDAAPLLGANPRDRHLAGAGTALGGERVDRVGDLEVALGQAALRGLRRAREARPRLSLPPIAAVATGEQAVARGGNIAGGDR